ncbi:polyprenyl synthetase family protein [soil metagenome]
MSIVAQPAPAFLADGLARVETALLASVQTGDPYLNEVASHLIKAGGTRMRPALCLPAAATALGADGGDRVDDAVAMGAVAVELVHLGSLYHDDVIDEATVRRTVESVNARWGNLTAILAGDFLLAKASEIAASLGTEVAGLLAATIGRLCQGEVVELRSAYDVGRDEDSYLASINGKTAALFATACRIGALLAALPRDRVEALTRFGENFGMAFQIVDDVLDVVATDEELGKPAGHDLVEGVYTLPVLRSLRSPVADDLRSLLGSPLSDDEREAALALVRSGPAVDASVDVARSYVAEAVEALAPFATGDAVSWLAVAAEGVLGRVTARAA